MSNITAILEEVRQASRVYVNERSLERIGKALLSEKEFWNIVHIADEIVPVVAYTLRVFEKYGYVRFEDEEVHLTPLGERFIQNELNPFPVQNYACDSCQGRGIDGMLLQNDKLEVFWKIHHERPTAIQEYDQGYITPESTLARYAIAAHYGDVDGKRILVLGDDDLVSLSLLLFGHPEEVVVVEIDKRLVEFIETWAKRLEQPVTILQHNLCEPLPEEYRRRFHTFFTDPPESFPAFRAFVGRGISALKGPGCAGYFGFTRREASYKKWHAIEGYLVENNAVITEIRHNFHEYVNWDYDTKTRAWELAPVHSKPKINWYRSALFRIELIDEPGGEWDTHFRLEDLSDDEASTT